MAVLYVAIASTSSGIGTACMVLILSVPLSFIWFQNEQLSEAWLRTELFRQFPALITRGIGWIVLIPILGFTVLVA